MTATATRAKAEVTGKVRPTEHKPVPQPELPKHLKPLTGPTGMKPSY
jgi:hypothetical protein